MVYFTDSNQFRFRRQKMKINQGCQRNAMISTFSLKLVAEGREPTNFIPVMTYWDWSYKCFSEENKNEKKKDSFWVRRIIVWLWPHKVKYNRALVFRLTEKKMVCFGSGVVQKRLLIFFFWRGCRGGGGGVNFEKEIQEVSKYLEQFILKGL